MRSPLDRVTLEDVTNGIFGELPVASPRAPGFGELRPGGRVSPAAIEGRPDPARAAPGAPADIFRKDQE